MSDDISIPRQGPGPVRTSFTHSYRARRTSVDAGTRRMFMAASALGLVLLGGMAVWTFGGHRAAGVPVIEADTRPLRVKPDNPGGMTVIGANEQIMGGSASGDDTGDLAPASEKPDPQALQAQRQVAAVPAAVPAIVPLPAASPAAPMTATPVAAPGSDLAAVANPPVPAPTGGPMVQIAALDSEAAATAEWQRLARKAPDLLGDRRPTIQRADHDGKAVWRLRTGGFGDTAEATEFCRRARAKGLGCSIANF